MARSRSRKGSPAGARKIPATPDEVRRILGPIDDSQLCRVLEFEADVDELQQARAALEGELPAHIGRPIEGAAARIYDLLSAEEAEMEPPAARGREGSQP